MTSKFAGQQYEQNTVHFLRASIAIGDDDNVVSLGWMPEGGNVIRGGVHVQTAFNSNTTDVLDLGFRNAPGSETDDPNAFATALDISAVGVIPTDAMAATAAVDLTLGAELTASYTATGTVATTGKAIAWLEYIVDNDGDVSGA